jgi:hypothetical protein
MAKRNFEVGDETTQCRGSGWGTDAEASGERWRPV